LLFMTFWLMGLLAGGFIAFNEDFVRLWVGQNLFAGTTINLLIVANFVLGVLSVAFGNLCMSLGNIKSNSIAVMIQNMLYIPLIFLGVRYLGLLGVVVAPVLATLFVTGWYYPYSFTKTLKYLSHERLQLLREGGISFTIAIIYSALFGHWNPERWIDFGALLASFSSCYVVSLLVFSKPFRNEARQILSQIKNFLTLIYK
jgi:O-antigen/teichoic acid export membrane protein